MIALLKNHNCISEMCRTRLLQCPYFSSEPQNANSLYLPVYYTEAT